MRTRYISDCLLTHAFPNRQVSYYHVFIMVHRLAISLIIQPKHDFMRLKKELFPKEILTLGLGQHRIRSSTEEGDDICC